MSAYRRERMSLLKKRVEKIREVQKLFSEDAFLETYLNGKIYVINQEFEGLAWAENRAKEKASK